MRMGMRSLPLGTNPRHPNVVSCKQMENRICRFIDSAGVTRSISANCIDSAGVSTDCIETVSETVTKKYFGMCLLSTLITS